MTYVQCVICGGGVPGRPCICLWPVPSYQPPVYFPHPPSNDGDHEFDTTDEILVLKAEIRDLRRRIDELDE